MAGVTNFFQFFAAASVNVRANKLSWKRGTHSHGTRIRASGEPVGNRATTPRISPCLRNLVVVFDLMKKPSAVAGPSALIADNPRASSVGPAQASPYKSAAEELDTLRKTFRLACQHYAKRIDMEIIRLRERVAWAGERQMTADGKRGSGRQSAKNAGAGQDHLYDLRDLTTLLRTLDIKPVAGRRKDLKKIESLVDELRLLVERWG